MELFSSIRNGNVEQVRMLVAENNNLINCYDGSGYTPLLTAIFSKQWEVVKVLLDYGADLNLPEKLKGQCAIQYAAVFENFELLELLFSKRKNVNVDFEDNFGNTALWTATFNAGKMAAKEDNFKIVQYLLKVGSDFNHKNKAGKSPLDFAKQIKSERLLRLFQC
jgi:ankyrin repeat protein